jgi:hypothetical protein
MIGHRPPAAVIVVDQGDHVRTQQVLATVRDRGLAVTHLTQPRWGLSASQNAGVEAAETEVVAIVDDDCVPDVDWVRVVERTFADAPGPLLLTGRVLPLPAEGERVAAVSTRESRRRMEWRRAPMPWHVGTGGNFAVTRSAFLAAGGNDERLGTGAPGRGANDLDLFYRLLRTGVTARYEPDLLVHHERVTAAEYRQRRNSYGFGVGAMLGVWLRRGDLRALSVLGGWLELRVKVGYDRRTDSGWVNEARVLVGTGQGLLRGLRISGVRPSEHV